MKGRRIFFLLGTLVFSAVATTRMASPAGPTATPASQGVSSTAQAEKRPEKREGQGYQLPPEKYKKAVDYARARHQLYFFNAAYGLVILILVLSWRLAPRFRDWAKRSSSRRFVQALVFVPLLLLTLDLFDLPTSLYGHWLERKYEQSIQGWGSWFWDWTKGTLLEWLLGTILIWILYGVIRRSAKRWWFYFWLATLPIIVVLLFITPVLIQPLFFKFEPLASTQPQLVAQIEKVVQRGGLQIPQERMFEMKASEKLKAINAYVIGIGASKRVVVWDTTIAKMTIPETLFVFGHEMGHYVLGHIRNAILFLAALLFVFLYLGSRGLNWTLGRWGARWAVRNVEDWASLPVLMLFLSLFGFLTNPVANAFSRYQEHNADIYSLEVIHGLVPNAPDVAAQAFQILGEVDLEEPDPSPFIKFWLYSHPPLDERIRFARSYDPWSRGQAPKFVK
jgi:Zn-dependent protease with chaperone function